MGILEASARILCTTIAAIPLAFWIPRFERELAAGQSVPAALISMGTKTNLLAAASITIPAVYEGISALLSRRKRRLVSRQKRAYRDRTVSVINTILLTSVPLIEQTLLVEVNARLFVARRDSSGTTRLYQDQRFAIEGSPVPTEMGLLAISIDEPGMVSAQAFRERRPLYKDLPDGHMRWYRPEVGRHVDPQQRWVLACPILRSDASTGLRDNALPPWGVLIYYSLESPPHSDSREARIRSAEANARNVSEALSLLVDSEYLTQIAV